MRSPEFLAFIDAVCKKVRYLPARWTISAELLNHLEESEAYLIETGMSAEEARAEAVKRMGDPEELGREMNKTHSPFIGWTMLVCEMLVGILGGYMLIAGVITGYTYVYDAIFHAAVPEFAQEEVLRRVEINETIRMPNTEIEVIEAVQTTDGILHVIYDTPWRNEKWGGPSLCIETETGCYSWSDMPLQPNAVETYEPFEGDTVTVYSDALEIRRELTFELPPLEQEGTP